jgi:vacuolar protein sorting-associated protein 33A
METLVELYNRNKDRGNKTYYPVFWPKRSAVCKEYLEARGLLSSFNLRDFSFDLIPLDNDLYSLEMKTFKELYIDNEYSIYNVVAESIHRLQCVFGKVRNVFGKGAAARSIY